MLNTTQFSIYMELFIVNLVLLGDISAYVCTLHKTIIIVVFVIIL